MTPNDLYKKIDELKSILDTFKPLKKVDEDRLWKKFRLEWNYNSNHMEGNTLTYGHTELLLILGKVTGDYNFREVEEMKAHDVAIKLVLDLASDSTHDLSEKFIRELNQVLLVEPFWKEAITDSGEPTKREILPGVYKKYTNSVRLENGELFHYPSPEETPALMGDLLETYRKNSVSTEIHPVWLAAMLHYDFVRIHPFDDGNGRVGRLLMNYVLLKCDLPPVIIKSTEKKAYLNALNKADVGDKEAFLNYIGEKLIWSLEKSIDAAKGKSIDDADDIDKEIELLKRSMNDSENLSLKKSRKALQDIYDLSLSQLFEEIIMKLSKFDELFFESDVLFYVSNAVETNILKSPGRSIDYIKNQLFFDAYNPTKYGYTNMIYSDGKPTTPFNYPEINEMKIAFNWKGYKKGGINTFNMYNEVVFLFNEFKYVVFASNEKDPIATKLYDKIIDEEERREIVNSIARFTMEDLRLKIDYSKKS